MTGSWTLVQAHRIAWFRAVLFLAAVALSPFSTAARETLYATSLRSQAAAGEAFVAGNLYVIDPDRATPTLVGAIHVGEVPIGVAAIAAHPKTGRLYGITAGLSPTIPRSLVSIDLARAEASVIARLGARGSDIGFASDGTLYMWAPDLQRMVVVNLENGATMPIGHEAVTGTAGGAIAIDDRQHKAIIAVKGAQGTLDTIDLQTGDVTEGPRLTGAEYEASIDNLTFSPSGLLYAVNSNGGAPSKAALMVVDPATGAMTPIGPLPDDVRGLIFAEEIAQPISRESIRVWVLGALSVIALGIIAYAIWRH